MALFEKREWKDRMAEFAGRRKLTDVVTGEEKIVDVARHEGLITQTGDAFNKVNMDDLEDRIATAIGDGDLPEELGNDIISAITQLNSDIQNIGIVLWRNTSLGDFDAQTVYLSSGDYNVYEIFYTNRGGDVSGTMSVRAVKGHGTELNTFLNGKISVLFQRVVKYVSDTSLYFEDTYYNEIKNNHYVIPEIIIGYKITE